METEALEHVGEDVSAKPLNQSKVKNTKKISDGLKMCVYFKDMECRIPICDIKACEKCNEGQTYCTRVTFIKNLVQKILMFIVCVLIFTDI